MARVRASGAPGIDYQVANLVALPFDSESFDAAYSERVFIHLGDPDVAMAELFRVLRPGGRLVPVRRLSHFRALIRPTGETTPRLGRRGRKEMIGVLIAADVITGMLALVFLAAGLQKLRQAEQQVATAQRLRIPWGRFRLIALPEIAASLGLAAGYAVMPLGAAAAAGLALLMVGAIVSRLRVRDSAAFVVGDLTFLGAAAAVAALRLTAA